MQQPTKKFIPFAIAIASIQLYNNPCASAGVRTIRNNTVKSRVSCVGIVNPFSLMWDLPGHLKMYRFTTIRQVLWCISMCETEDGERILVARIRLGFCGVWSGMNGPSWCLTVVQSTAAGGTRRRLFSDGDWVPALLLSLFLRID